MNLEKSTGIRNLFITTHWFIAVNVETRDEMSLKERVIFSCHKMLEMVA